MLLRFKHLLKDPLIHFLLLGTIIFITFDWGRSAISERNSIEITDQRLMSMLQTQLSINSPELLNQQWQQMNTIEKQRLQRHYIEREVLFREAKKLGLDSNDNVIRSHLINKIRFLLGDLAAATHDPSEAAIIDYYNANKQDYVKPPSLSFSHIFIKAGNNDWNQSDQIASQLLRQAVAQNWTISDALSIGDSFPYHKNYSAKSQQFLSSHFGRPFANTIFKKQLPINQWSGPFRSAFGSHLIYVSASNPQSTPQLETIKATVINDYRRSQLQQRTQAEIDKLIDGYHIRQQ